MDSSQQTLIYLDTADWSHLEAGRVPVVEGTLRELAQAGARFVISFDHLVECAGLKGGLVSRLQYLRAFPGTLLYRCGGDQLMSVYVGGFVSRALDLDCPQQGFEVVPFETVSLLELQKMVPLMRMVRGFQHLHAKLVSDASPVGVRQDKQERDRTRKLFRLVRAGASVAELHAYVGDKIGFKPGLRGVVQRAAGRVLYSMNKWGVAKGIFTTEPAPDLVFEELVGRTLPLHVRRSPETMQVLHRAWSEPTTLKALSPTLSCIAAIRRAQTPTKDVRKIKTTEVDQRHVAFLPQVHVFTCDKRTHQVAVKALAESAVRTSILRTGQLQEVVAATETWLGSR